MTMMGEGAMTEKTAQLLEIADKIAKHCTGGHLTILAFTTEWKAAFGTVTDREAISDLEGYPTLDLALEALINDAGHRP